jgi:hypothetical protein
MYLRLKSSRAFTDNDNVIEFLFHSSSRADIINVSLFFAEIAHLTTKKAVKAHVIQIFVF